MSAFTLVGRSAYSTLNIEAMLLRKQVASRDTLLAICFNVVILLGLLESENGGHVFLRNVG
jgi:hypothetical protein